MICFGSPTTNSLPGTSGRSAPVLGQRRLGLGGEVEGDLGLERVGVLELVDEDALVARLRAAAHGGMVAEQVARPDEQVLKDRLPLRLPRGHARQREVAQEREHGDEGGGAVGLDDVRTVLHDRLERVLDRRTGVAAVGQGAPSFLVARPSSSVDQHRPARPGPRPWSSPRGRRRASDCAPTTTCASGSSGRRRRAR